MTTTTTANELFVKATRENLLFDFRGQQTVIDLWKLSLDHLDEIYAELSTKLEQVERKSLRQKKSAANADLELKIEVVKYIYDFKETEAKAKLEAKEKAALKQKLLEIKAAKQEKALLDLTPEELDAKIAELD